jgi:hypothetical protein
MEDFQASALLQSGSLQRFWSSNRILMEYWDVIQDEATAEQSKSKRPHPPRMLTSEDIRPYDIPYWTGAKRLQVSHDCFGIGAYHVRTDASGRGRRGLPLREIEVVSSVIISTLLCIYHHKSPFHEKAGEYQAFSFIFLSFFLSSSLFLLFPNCSRLSQAASVATLPSALVVERLSLGASWVYSIQ